MSDGCSDLEVLRQADKVHCNGYQAINAQYMVILKHLCIVPLIAGSIGRFGAVITDYTATVSAYNSQRRIDKTSH